MLPKILFADDDPLMHQLYKPHVERAGYEWIGASNGHLAGCFRGRQIFPDYIWNKESVTTV